MVLGVPIFKYIRVITQANTLWITKNRFLFLLFNSIIIFYIVEHHFGLDLRTLRRKCCSSKMLVVESGPMSLP